MYAEIIEFSRSLMIKQISRVFICNIIQWHFAIEIRINFFVTLFQD